jgi:hypothetical protein
METFLVRVWTPDGDESLDGMRGTAVHLTSGWSVTFTESDALISFLAEAAGAGGRDQPDSLSPSPARADGQR